MNDTIMQIQLPENYRKLNEDFTALMADMLEIDWPLENKLDSAAMLLRQRHRMAAILYNEQNTTSAHQEFAKKSLEEIQRMTIEVVKTYIPLLEASVQAAPNSVVEFCGSYGIGSILCPQVADEESLVMIQLGFIGSEALLYMQTNAGNNEFQQNDELWRVYAETLLPYAAPDTRRQLEICNVMRPTISDYDESLQALLPTLPTKLTFGKGPPQ